MSLDIRLRVNGKLVENSPSSLMPVITGRDNLDGDWFIHQSTYGDSFDTITTTLEGDAIIHFLVEDGASYSVLSNREKLIRVSQILSLVEHNSQDSEYQGVFPFRFDFAISDLPSYNMSLLSSKDLPPSIQLQWHADPNKDTGPIKVVDCHVIYNIRCQLAKEGLILAETTRPIQFYPVSTPQPPLCLEDFPGEYAILVEKGLLSFPRIKRIGFIKLESLEPRPVQLGGSGVFTEVCLKMQLISCQKARGPKRPSFCTISSTLKSTSFVSVDPQLRCPTSISACNSFYLKEIPCIHLQQMRKAKISDWSRVPESGNVMNGSKITEQWEATSNVIINCEGLGFLQPTFSSSLVTRRYKLVMIIRFQHYSWRRFRLEIPVQVHY